MKDEVLDAIQHLVRNIKRRSSSLTPDSHARAQGKTLRLIEQYDGMRANELAEMLDIRPSSLTQKLDKLEAGGNIRRVRDRRDARVVRIYITEHGRYSLELRKKDKIRDFSDCLTEEEKEFFCELCNRLSDNLERIREEEKALQAGVTLLRKEKDEFNHRESSDEADKIG